MVKKFYDTVTKAFESVIILNDTMKNSNCTTAAGMKKNSPGTSIMVS